jgi:phasin
VNDADVKVEGKTNPPNGNVQASEERGMPLFELPKMFRGIAKQSVVQAKESSEKMRAASEEIADMLRETYSTNARSAANYGFKVIEISGVNTNSALDFLTNLMGTKSLSEIIKLSATQGRKNFDAASAQNKELWDLVQKLAIESAEPIRNSFTRSLQKVS